MVDTPNPDRLLVPRHTGRGIVVHDGKILLMERWRPGLHYFSITGGGIEEGETAEQAAVREIYEETTVKVDIDRLVFTMVDGDIEHSIYLCKYIEGEPELTADAPEFVGMHEDNRFKPGWITISELPDISLGYWQPLKTALIEGLENNFSGDAVTVTITS